MMQPFISHYIQKDILRSLSRSQSLGFSEMQPDGLGSNAFGYHLKQLINLHFVDKLNGKYFLTREGIRYVSSATRTNLDLLQNPKILCLLLIENDAGEFVMHRRNGAPFVGQYTFPGGVLFFGDSLEKLVERQLLEKIGFVLPMQHRGLVNLRHVQDNATISHSHAHLFCSRVEGRLALSAKDQRFTPEWINPETVAADRLMPDVKDLIDAIRNNSAYFYLDITKRS